MGCVYYYVLSNGDHLFGDTIKRQANILSHDYDFEMRKLLTQRKRPYENILAAQLITEMIAKDSNKRPNAEAVLKHPMFWREEKILSFLQDVSDRIEKLDIYTDPLRTLERNAKFVIRDDWKSHLDESIREDLRRHRDYHSVSVRDLLRALRNKVRLNFETKTLKQNKNCFYFQKHHFYELSADIQRTLGTPPCDFVKYWIHRFPYLISHTFHAMESCSKEASFRRYYCPTFTFAKPDYLFDEDLDNEELRDIYEVARALYNKSPKKENRQPTAGNFNKNVTPSKRGTYNFNSTNNQNQPINSAFITREEMMGTRRKKQPLEEEKIVWTNPK
jgi:serine/threonine-protein kinase/endoribonuclease IRE1